MGISASSAGFAVVTMNDTICEPEPKCFAPASRYRSVVPSTRAAVALVLDRSPPLPGSEASVPQKCPSMALWNTVAR